MKTKKIKVAKLKLYLYIIIFIVKDLKKVKSIEQFKEVYIIGIYYSVKTVQAFS